MVWISFPQQGNPHPVAAVGANQREKLHACFTDTFTPPAHPEEERRQTPKKLVSFGHFIGSMISSFMFFCGSLHSFYSSDPDCPISPLMRTDHARRSVPSRGSGETTSPPDLSWVLHIMQDAGNPLPRSTLMVGACSSHHRTALQSIQ